MVHSITEDQYGAAPHERTITVGFDSTNVVSVDIDAKIRGLLSGQDRNNPDVVSQKASDWLQMLVDTGPPGNPGRILLADLDPEDPDAIEDPAQPNNFWARIHPADQLGNGPNAEDIWRPIAAIDPLTLLPYGGVATHLVGRAFLVTFVWDGTNYTFLTRVPNVLR